MPRINVGVDVDETTYKKIKHLISNEYELREFIKKSIHFYLRNLEQYGPRKPCVYWVQGTKNERDKLIFDMGYEGGFIYIYELKEAISSDDAEKEVENYYKYHQGELMTYYFIKIRFGKEPTLEWRLSKPCF